MKPHFVAAVARCRSCFGVLAAYRLPTDQVGLASMSSSAGKMPARPAREADAQRCITCGASYSFGMRFLFVMDPAESMAEDKDTSFAFMLGSLARGHECWHCLPHEVSYRNTGVGASARRIVVSAQAPHVALFERQRLDEAEIDAVFVRKDPPFDSSYLHLTQLLALVQPRCFVFNAPRGLQAANEKLFALKFSAFTPATLVSADPAELLEFLSAIGGHGVLKPLDGAGGFGVVQLNHGDKNTKALIDLLTLEGRRPALLQEFLPEVAAGDKRVLLLEGRVLGAIRRIPQRDDIRANIHVGGTVEATELTPGEVAIVEGIRPSLVEQGLFFVGLDLIGERLIEINVTSPTGIQQLSRHVGRPLAEDVVAWVEQRVKAAGSSALWGSVR
jgi:glutathione synthase